MEYNDIIKAFMEKYNFTKKDCEELIFKLDVRETKPMVFRFDGREILGSVFKDEIRFYERV